MNPVLNLFWNAQEHRLRAVWRLILQFITFFLLNAIFSAVWGGVLAVILVGQTGLSDPSTLQRAIMEHPLTLVFSTVSSLLAMLITYLIFMRVDRRPFKAYGFHFSPTWWKDFGFGLFLGAFLMVLIFLTELALGWVRVEETFRSIGDIPFGLAILGPVIIFICVGIYEEMLSRGYQIRNAAEGLRGRLFSPATALLLSYLLTSSFFGFLHATNPNASAVSTLMLVVAGLFLGLGYILTGELAIPIGLHITWNFFQGNVFGFPVSGTAAGPTFIAVAQEGPDMMTGGAFGPEAGLIGLAAIVLGCVLTVLWLKSQGRLRLREELAVYQAEGRFIRREEAQREVPAGSEG